MGQKGCRFSLFLFSPVQVGHSPLNMSSGWEQTLDLMLLSSQSEYDRRCLQHLKGEFEDIPLVVTFQHS